MKLTRIMIVSKNTFAEIRDKYSIEMTEKELEEEICFIVLPDNENDIFGYLNLTFYNMSKFMEEYNNQTSTIEASIEIKDGDNIMHKLSLLSPLFKVYFHTNNFCFAAALAKETLIESIDDKKRFVDIDFKTKELDGCTVQEISKTIRENCPKIKYNFADCEIV